MNSKLLAIWAVLGMLVMLLMYFGPIGHFLVGVTFAVYVNWAIAKPLRLTMELLQLVMRELKKK